MATSNAFDKVFSSLNVVSDSWLTISEFRSVLRRLREFERAVGSHRPVRAQLVPPGVGLSDAAAAGRQRCGQQRKRQAQGSGGEPPSEFARAGVGVSVSVCVSCSEWAPERAR